MHNLLLVTSKNIVKLWINRKILKPQDLETIEARSKLLSFPYDVGRIPCKIASSFSGFMADQWRIWTTVISPIVLTGILPVDDHNCWLLFVNACLLLITRIITKDSVKEADQYLVLFCKKFQRLYGNAHCTPNMHLHLHLKYCLLDYGPVHGFWCFPFERFYGILGVYPTNNLNVEVQMMNRFIRHQTVKRLTNSEWFKDQENELHVPKGSVGSLQETNISEVLSLVHLATVADLCSITFEIPKDSPYIKAISPVCEKVLSPEEANCLYSFYQQLYPNKTLGFSRHFIHTARR